VTTFRAEQRVLERLRHGDGSCDKVPRPRRKAHVVVVMIASIPYPTTCRASSSGLKNRLTTRKERPSGSARSVMPVWESMEELLTAG